MPVPSTVRAAGVLPRSAAERVAFEAELTPLVPDALRLATAMLLNSAAAEDAVQEACLNAWRHRTQRRPGSDLRPWLLAIVANRCRESRRGRWWRMAPLPAVTVDRGVAAVDAAAVLDLRRALMGLPHRRRLAVVLRYYLDLPYGGVATVMGCSVDAAKALVRRATTDLQRALAVTEGDR